MRAGNSLKDILRRRRLNVLGVNSGTSMDGLDLTLLRIDDRRPSPRFRVLATGQNAIPGRIRRALMSAASTDTLDKRELIVLDMALGRAIAAAARSIMRRHPVDVIASHGQTVAHYPKSSPALWRGPTTLQIGSLDVIAHLSGRVTVGDFRAADTAAGGMGAPLSGYYHHLLFGTGCIVLNLGGIANISVSQYSRGRLRVIAFDIGPGNMISDELARRLLGRPFDRHGREAMRGTAIAPALRRVLNHPYFRRRPPKTCGREEFGAAFVEQSVLMRGASSDKPADWLATVVEITARATERAISRWIKPITSSRRLIVSGGGGCNRALMRRLRDLLIGWELVGSDEFGIPPQFVEPAGFAILAHETLRGRAGNLGSATGGKPAVLGVIAQPYTG